MQRIMNDPDNIVDEMLEGFLKVHADIVETTENPRVVKAKNIPEGKVGVVTGGGSGHKPAFIGYVGAHTVHRAQQQRKDVELRRLQADRRQRGIEVDQPEHQRHRQIDERPPERRADGFSDLLRPGRAPARPGEALKIRVVPVDIHISVLSASGEALAIVPIIPDLGRDVQQFWVAQGRFANHSRNRRVTGPRS